MEPSVARAPEGLMEGRTQSPATPGVTGCPQRGRCPDEAESESNHSIPRKWSGIKGTVFNGGMTSPKTWYLKELPGGWKLQTHKQAAQKGRISGARGPAGQDRRTVARNR